MGTENTHRIASPPTRCVVSFNREHHQHCVRHSDAAQEAWTPKSWKLRATHLTSSSLTLERIELMTPRRDPPYQAKKETIKFS
jgi:hypothetical protein